MRRRGLTLAELILTLAVLAVLLLIVVPTLLWRREEARRIRCRNNLNQLARCMATYTWNGWYYPCPIGRGRDPEDYNGAEWFAALYWVGVVPDPGVFLCPTSGDTNHDGVDIDTHRATAAFGSQTVSYAGLHYRSQTKASGQPIPGAMRVDYAHPLVYPIASDDTQGSINHGAGRRGGLAVLFSDSHVEWRARDDVDPETAVGDQGPGRGAPKPLLWQLRN
ncbi:MAG: prepilin-type N-terminal cleavage/methylation domain-containing protein [Candidatus Brocadiae bacterium]|nr:prepilin-type N-terminal cleavage/methylation domain-containing protein [Candidatus Brocadiia bacterium]